MELDLKLIAARLEGLEETIIAKLIARAQFRVNKIIYNPGASGFSGVANSSLFQIRLRAQEEMDARFGRFHAPDERPFCSNLPESHRQVNIPPTSLHIDDYEKVNLSEEILDAYMHLLPELCHEGDDGHYGSSVEHDVYALQAVARRIHYGTMYVAESKFTAEPETYTALLQAGDLAAVDAKLTRPEVEEKIICRVRDKVNALQQTANPAVRVIIDPELVVKFYREYVIPLTKKGEIAYLAQRI
jgi:chorismate mutase